MRLVIGFIALAGFVAVAGAQTAPTPSTPSAPAAAPVQPETKAVDCRAQAKAKGLNGPAARDAVALCREELRLACLKEAIDKKIAGKERREFIRICGARPKGGDQDGKS